MNYKQADIAKYLKTPNLAVRCVVIYGSNEGMIADYARQFAQTVCTDLNDAFQAAVLNMDALEKDIGLLFGEYNSRSLMGGRRVVMIKDGNNNLTAHLKSLFADTTSDTLLIITSTTLNTKSSLVTLAKEREDFALISCYEDREQDIFSFAKEFFIKNNITINNNAMQLLCHRLSNDRKVSLGELEKLRTYLGNRRNVEPEDIAVAVSDTSNSSEEDLCYFTAMGNIDKALEAYGELLREGGNPVSIVRTLCYHFQKILACLALIEKGQTIANAAASLRPPLMFFRKDDFLLQLRIWKRDSLLNVLELLYNCERSCKTTNLPAEEILSYTIMQIGGAARKLQR